MGNVLDREKQHQILALGRLGWSLRQIEDATGVRRETASRYLKAAGVAVRRPGRWGHPDPKAAIEVITDSGPSPALPRPGRSPSASACEPYRELVEAGVAQGRDAMSMWQDLVDDHGFAHGYQSVRRCVVTLRGESPLEAHPVIETAPGAEGQVDDGDGPMVRHPETGKYRRMRLFVFTLGCSRYRRSRSATTSSAIAPSISMGRSKWPGRTTISRRATSDDGSLSSGTRSTCASWSP